MLLSRLKELKTKDQHGSKPPGRRYRFINIFARLSLKMFSKMLINNGKTIAMLV